MGCGTQGGQTNYLFLCVGERENDLVTKKARKRNNFKVWSKTSRGGRGVVHRMKEGSIINDEPFTERGKGKGRPRSLRKGKNRGKVALFIARQGGRGRRRKLKRAPTRGIHPGDWGGYTRKKTRKVRICCYQSKHFSMWWHRR